MKVLFVCRANLQRSPTAEDMVEERSDGGIVARSAGVSSNASTRVDDEILDWADGIYPMTEKIRKRMEAEFPDKMKRKYVRILGIEDRYFRGESKLVEKLLREFSEDEYLAELVDGEGPEE